MKVVVALPSLHVNLLKELCNSFLQLVLLNIFKCLFIHSFSFFIVSSTKLTIQLYHGILTHSYNSLVIYSSVYTKLHFLLIFLTYYHGIIAIDVPYYGLSKHLYLYNFFKNLQAFYYFDMIREEVLHLFILTSRTKII